MWAALPVVIVISRSSSTSDLSTAQQLMMELGEPKGWINIWP